MKTKFIKGLIIATIFSAAIHFYKFEILNHAEVVLNSDLLLMVLFFTFLALFLPIRVLSNSNGNSGTGIVLVVSIMIGLMLGGTTTMAAIGTYQLYFK